MLEQQQKYRQKAGVAELKPKIKTPENQQIYYYHTDHLGTPQELTDQDGDIVWSAQYQAWGRVHSIERPQKLTYTQHGNTITESWVAAEQIEQPLRFQGQYHDSETGLHYNRYRYYDPDIGRFISQDPIGLLGGINLYQYAPNPVGWVDPFGLCPNVKKRKNNPEHKPDEPAPNLTPEGGGRRAALNEAKRRNNIPTSQSPKITSKNYDRDGNVQPGRAYHYEIPSSGGGKRIVTIRDDSKGHFYGPNNRQNRGPHFNDTMKNHYDY